MTFGGGISEVVSQREIPQKYQVKEFHLSERDNSITITNRFKRTQRKESEEESDGGTFGKPMRVMKDWQRAKKAVDVNLKKRESRIQEEQETKQKRYDMIKAHNEQPSEQIGEDDSESSLDLASDEDENLPTPLEEVQLEIDEPSITT